jgi:hypothetical protein
MDHTGVVVEDEPGGFAVDWLLKRKEEKTSGKQANDPPR